MQRRATKTGRSIPSVVTHRVTWRVDRKVGKAPSSMDERGSIEPGGAVANVPSVGGSLAVLCSQERKGCGLTLGQLCASGQMARCRQSALPARALHEPLHDPHDHPLASTPSTSHQHPLLSTDLTTTTLSPAPLHHPPNHDTHHHHPPSPPPPSRQHPLPTALRHPPPPATTLSTVGTG